jgi:hypothetical protein
MNGLEAYHNEMLQLFGSTSTIDPSSSYSLGLFTPEKLTRGLMGGLGGCSGLPEFISRKYLRNLIHGLEAAA